MRMVKVEPTSVMGVPCTDIVCVDTETTGFRAGRPLVGASPLSLRQDGDADELLQVSVVRGDYSVVFDEYIRPSRHTSWDAAERVHHITPERVAHCHRIEGMRRRISRALDARMVVGYNVGFDVRFLNAAGIAVPAGAEVVDVMQVYRRAQRQKRQVRLTDACAAFGIEFDAHDSLADSRATLALLYALVRTGRVGA